MTYIAHPTDAAQEKALKAFCKAMKIPVKKTADERPYTPEFEAMIKQGEEDLKAGRFSKMTLEELDNLWK